MVTRYFGGIKLGAGGLIRAYNHSAAIGLEASSKVELKLFRRIRATVDYPMLATIENWIRNHGLRTGETEYTDKVTVNILTAAADTDSTALELTNLTAARCQLEIGDEEYIEVPI